MLAGRTSPSSRIKPLLLVWCFCLLFLPLLIRLGLWQLDRAAETQTALDQYLALGRLSPVMLTPASFDTSNRYRPLRVVGEYRQERYLLDNRTRDGRVGYEWVQRFESEEGVSFWVNRGWLPAPKYRDQVPEPDAAPGHQALYGVLYRELSINQNEFSMPEIIAQYDWPRRIQFLDQLALAFEGGTEHFRWVFRLENTPPEMASDETLGLTSAVATLNDSALDLTWSELKLNPAKNRGYAFQWFAMSVALICLTLFATFKLVKEKT